MFNHIHTDFIFSVFFSFICGLMTVKTANKMKKQSFKTISSKNKEFPQKLMLFNTVSFSYKGFPAKLMHLFCKQSY